METTKRNIKKIKLSIWFFVAIMLDLTLMHKFRIFSARPTLTYILITSVMLFEEDFLPAMVIAFFASVICASLLGQSFGLEVMFIMAAAVAVFSAGKKIKYIPAVIVSGFMSAIFSAAHLAFAQVFSLGIASLHAMGNVIVANAIYAFAAALLMFVPLKNTVYRKNTDNFIL